MLRSISSHLSVSAVFLGFLILAGPARAQQQPTGTWALEQSGEYFYYGTSCTDGTYLYIMGGYQQTGNTTAEVYARFRRYDPAANSWINMPLIASGTAAGSTVWGQQYPGAAAYHSWNGTNRIFLLGGYLLQGSIGSTSYSGITTNNIRVFTFTSATTGTWALMSSSLPQVSYYNAATVMNDRIYCMGGASTTMMAIINPAQTTPSVSSGTAMPGYLYYHGACAVPSLGKIYVMGGYGPAGYTGINYEYTPEDNDPTTNDAGGTWATRAQISNGSAVQPLYLGVGLINLNNRVYVIGYNSSSGVYNQLFEYNPITNTWTQRANQSYGGYYWPAWVAINGKGYFYGGAVYPTTGEEYTPPNFGSPPNVPTAVAQSGSQAASSLQAQADSTLTDGWTNSQIVFSANVTDPDANQQVRFMVQVKPESVAWTSSQVVSLQTPLGAQGLKTLAWTIPANGGYDWRWRVEDAFNNSHPLTANTWVEAFGSLAAPNTVSPDFRSDQLAPTDPVGVAPSGIDIQVQDPNIGAVTLSWVEATDNGPVSGISYEIQVAREGGFIDIEAQLFSTAGTSSYPVSLSVSRDPKFWRIRARDVGGNFSQWSAPLSFRVTYNDGVDHGSGDADKNCGFASGGAAPLLGAALLGLMILCGAIRRALTASRRSPTPSAGPLTASRRSPTPSAEPLTASRRSPTPSAEA